MSAPPNKTTVIASFFSSTLPTNIMRNIVPNNNMAVEKFSGKISRQTIDAENMINLKAIGFAC